ncbi:hypothetical protein ACFHWD_03655 [Clostridium sp. MT-14]|uniref:hypothetical protein n=1 Tax=Clostridium sp. MT-14 TaxID=3348360 RepID=UPI0035F4AB0D
MAITEKLLKEKGFKLNTYPEGKFWEYITEDDEKIEAILQDEYCGDENNICLQLQEDFTNIIEQVDIDTYDLTEEQFLKLIKRIPSKEIANE